MIDLWSVVSGLESRINEGQAEMEVKLERHQKEVTSIVEQQTRHLREDIEATRRVLEARLAEVDAWFSRAGAAVKGPTLLR